MSKEKRQRCSAKFLKTKARDETKGTVPRDNAYTWNESVLYLLHCYLSRRIAWVDHDYRPDVAGVGRGSVSSLQLIHVQCPVTGFVQVVANLVSNVLFSTPLKKGFIHLSGADHTAMTALLR